ncbi:MAG: hypothetical protein FJY97_09155 [candidate division Zixibacteria bacterium]|nr:hypothetical protein [candidate division Zixibacteria bacterium]
MIGQILVVENDPIVVQVAKDLLGYDGLILSFLQKKVWKGLNCFLPLRSTWC